MGFIYGRLRFIWWTPRIATSGKLMIGVALSLLVSRAPMGFVAILGVIAAKSVGAADPAPAAAPLRSRMFWYSAIASRIAPSAPPTPTSPVWAWTQGAEFSPFFLKSFLD